MSILTIIIVLVVIGVVLWLINSYIPMEAWVKKLLNIIAVIFIVIWLLKAFGLFASLNEVKI